MDVRFFVGELILTCRRRGEKQCTGKCPLSLPAHRVQESVSPSAAGEDFQEAINKF